MKKNVLFIMNHLHEGGAERSLVNLLQELDYDKYDIDLIIFQCEGAFLSLVPPQVRIIKDEEELNCLYATKSHGRFSMRHPILSVEHFLYTKIARKHSNSPEGSRQYRWVNYYSKKIPTLKKEYDIAISYMHCEQLYYLVDKVKAKRKLAWIHNDYTKVLTDREIDLHYLKQVDEIVSISDECVNILKEMFPPVADKCHMLPNISSSEVIRKLSAEYYPEEYTKDGTLILISIGRIVSQKGFDYAIEAANVLKQRGVRFKWFILGDGQLKSELLLMVQKYQLEDCFLIAGLRSNPYPYIANADIMVQTSRFEGKSVVLDEAKILGKPIVSTNYTTVSDQVNENEGIITDMTGAGIADGIQQMVPVKERYTEYLLQHEYGNTECVKGYEALMDGTTEGA